MNIQNYVKYSKYGQSDETFYWLRAQIVAQIFLVY